MNSGQTPDLWNDQAATFDDEPDHGLRNPATRAAWRRVLDDVLPDEAARILDVGCGTGSLSVLLAESGHHVHGIDFAPEMVARAQAKSRDRGVTATFEIGDAADPQLPRASYDVVLCRHVLWALADPVEAVANWVDLLAPGGRLVLVEGYWENVGLRAKETEDIVRAHRSKARVVPLTEAILWGKEITDERYLVVSTR